MYVAVKGGEKAIDAAHRLLAETRRGDLSVPSLSVSQIKEQLPFAVDRVMTEGNIYDRELAALAIKQSAGDMVEAIFLLRAYRTTLPRFQSSDPVNTSEMSISRRISAIYKDLPGGQQLGSTFDYTHRLLDFALMAEEQSGESDVMNSDPTAVVSHFDNVQQDTSVTSLDEEHEVCPKVMALLENEGLMRRELDDNSTVTDISRDPVSYPCDRSARLQSLVRADEGFLLSLGYSTQRGYGRNHPFSGEIRTGNVSVSIVPEELGFAIDIGEIELTECEMVTGFDVQDDAAKDNNKPSDAQFTRGYGLVFGAAERKAMAIALVDRALQCNDYGESPDSPAQQEEFVLSHCDNVEAAGFLSHLKLPHYVDFQSELELLRNLRNKSRSESQSKSRNEGTEKQP